MATRSHLPPRRREASRSGRAAPLSAPERRAAIIAATIPLLREHGTGLTSRRIAQAAGVAEGTIFSVFEDKDSLITAAVEAALAPDATVAALGAIDAGLPLEARLAEAVATLQAHLADIWRLLAAVGSTGRVARKPGRNEAFLHFGPPLEALLEPARGELRAAPAHAARVLLGLTLGCTMPQVVDEPLAPDDIVALFLDGVREAR